MSKYKWSILVAVVFTIPLVGYFLVNSYLWLFAGTEVDSDRLFASLAGGSIALWLNIVALFHEDKREVFE